MRERTWEFTRWSSHTERVTACRVEFAPGGALVFEAEDHIVLAVKPGDWNNLREVRENTEEGTG